MNYKLSNYNNFTEYEDKIICFNTLSRSLFTLSLEKFHMYKELNNNLTMLEKHMKDLFYTFVKTRFIIPKEINEIEVLKFRNIKDVFLNNTYKLFIIPTMDCNFRCWYCYETHVECRMSDEMMERIKRHIDLLINSNKISNLNLSWFGGEPLLNFEDIIYPLSFDLQKIISKNNKLFFGNSITTNGYLIEDNFIEKFDEINLTNFQITLDGNEINHNKSRNINGKPTFTRIIDNINKLCARLKDSRITLRINYDNQTLDCIEELIGCFPKKIRNKITMDFQRIWQVDTEDSLNYDKLRKKKELFYRYGFVVNNYYFGNIGAGYKCYADRWYQAIINYNGQVYKCTARDFEKENSYGYLQKNGRIKWYPHKIIKRFSKAPFENEMCLNCKLLPMCMGPCTQKMTENQSQKSYNTCLLKSVDFAINDYIINMYKGLLNGK